MNMSRYLFSSLCAIAVGVGFSAAAVYGFRVVSGQTIVRGPLASVIDSVNNRIDSITSRTIEITPHAQAIVNGVRGILPDTNSDADYEEDPTSVIEQAKNTLPHHKDINASASAYVVLDTQTGVITAEKNAGQALPIASISKLVTAMVARTKMTANQRIEITEPMLRAYGNTARFRIGEKYQLNELLYPLLMVSSNDAAEVIAQAYGRRAFIQAMNDWASSIGAYHTYFDDPSGLSPNNVASARDIATIMQWIAQNDPSVLDITLTKVKNLRTHTWVNPTHFLNLSSYRGGKNGYTTEAGRTGVSMFKVVKDGTSRTYILVILNSQNRDHDMLELLDFVSS